MTLPNPGVSLSIQQIYNEAQLSASSPWYNKGYSLGAYRGIQWWKDDTTTGTFPAGTISINDFYSKRSTTPVTPGSSIYYSSGNFSVPLYSSLTVVVRGGGGGGAGCSGNIAAGSNGFAGGTSYFWTVSYAAGGGAGGAPFGANGAAGAGSDGTPAGGAGGSNPNGVNGGNGGAGGKGTFSFTNPVSGGGGPSVGATVYVQVGGGGGGGAGGQFFNGFTVLQLPNGNPGGNGYVEIYWS
jgi:hypothetical protein